jgi:hypothetical protein
MHAKFLTTEVTKDTEKKIVTNELASWENHSMDHDMVVLHESLRDLSDLRG